MRSQHSTQRKKAESLSKTLGQDKGAHSQHLCSTYYWKSSHSNQTRRNKDASWRQERGKIVPYAEDMTLHLQNPKECRHKLSELREGARWSAEWGRRCGLGLQSLRVYVCTQSCPTL